MKKSFIFGSALCLIALLPACGTRQYADEGDTQALEADILTNNNSANNYTPTPTNTAPAGNPTPTPTSTSTPTPTSTSCADVVPDPTGCLVASCSKVGAGYQVSLSWCANPSATQNVIRKRTSSTGWTQNNYFSVPQRSYTDTAVTSGTTYVYQVKYSTTSVSNEVQIPIGSCACGQ